MRLLFVHASREDSVEYAIQQAMVNHSDSRHIEVLFLCQSHTHDRSRDIPLQSSHLDGTRYYDFGRNMALSPRPSRNQRFLMMLRQYPGALALLADSVRTFRPDIIYTSQQAYDIHLARLVSRVYHIPSVIHIHYPVGPWLGQATLRAIRSTPWLLAVSEFIRQGAIACGVAPNCIHTVPNPANVEQFHGANTHAALRAEFDWPVDTPVILAVGRLDPSKGHIDLISAFAHVQAQMPCARLLICGATATRDHYDMKLKQQVAELGLGQSVVFAGEYTDISKVYAGSTIFCLPTKEEAFGMVFLEAMLCGLPVVAYASGAIPEIVIHQSTGMLSQPGDVHALAENLLLLLRTPDLGRTLGDAGRQRALTTFHPSQVASVWQTTLQRLVRQRDNADLIGNDVHSSG